MLGRINKLETFGSVDGPGVRFVVFTQGCPMRCLFCHNPETWDFKGDKAGSFDISAEDLLKKALRYRSYWGKDGGITVSGGEPLMQMDFLLEFFTLAKAAGVHTCIDTSGVNFVRTEPYFSTFRQLMEVTDLLLVDPKIIDPKLHKKLTGHSIDHNLDLFRYPLQNTKKWESNTRLRIQNPQAPIGSKTQIGFWRQNPTGKTNRTPN